jgi:hypothetical protein
LSASPENPFEFEEQAPPGHAYEKLVPRGKRMWTAGLMLAGVLAWEAHCVGTLMLPARVATWPKTRGVITRSDLYVQVFGSLYQARIEYRYEVAGVGFKSDRVTCDLDARSHGSESEVFPLIERFPKGAEVEVHYAPNNPGKSYLLPQVSPIQYLLAVGLIGVAGIIVAYLIVEWRRGKRQTAAGNA